MTRTWLLIGLALSLWGCAARTYVIDGGVQAQQGDWIAAHAHYERAAQLRPNSEKIATLTEHARRRALDQLQGLFNASFAGDDLPTAFDVLMDANAIGPDERWIPTGIESVAKERDAEADALLTAGRLDDAYELAVESRRWTPERPASEQRVVAVREALAATVRTRAADQDFVNARALANRILVHEPSQRALADVLLAEVDAGWSDHARRAATTAARRGRHGAAFVWRGLARARSEAPADQTSLVHSRQRFLAREGLVFDVRVDGSDARSRPIRQQLAASVTQPLGVSWRPDAVHPTIGGSLRLLDPVCEQSREDRPARHTYVAGVVQVENPEHTRLLGLVDELHRDARRAHRDLRTQDQTVALAREDLEYARATAVPLERAFVRQQRELDAAILSQERAIRALEDAEAAAEEVRQHTAELAASELQIRKLQHQLGVQKKVLIEARRTLAGSPPTPPAPEAAPPKGPRPPRPDPTAPATPPAQTPPTFLASRDPAAQAARNAVVRAEKRLQVTKTALHQATEHRAALQAPSPLIQRLATEVPSRRQALQQERRHDVEQRTARLDQQLRGARQAIRQAARTVTDHEAQRNLLLGRARQAESEVVGARERLARTRPTVGQQVLDTYDYTVAHWTRSCTVRAELRTRSSTVPSVQRSLSFGYETIDTTFDAVPSVGLEGDPLVFPTDDAQLVQRADNDVVAAIQPLLADITSQWRTRRLEQAERATRDEDRTRALVAAWLSGDEPPSSALTEHLVSVYGLMDVSVLTR